MYLNLNQKMTHLNLKKKNNRFEECKQRYDRVQNENENKNETSGRESSFYAANSLGDRYNHSKAKKERHPRKKYSEKCTLNLRFVHNTFKRNDINSSLTR